MSDIPEDESMQSADVIDQGTALGMRQNADAVKQARRACEPQRIPDGKGGWIVQVKQADGTYPIPECVDCEDDIPPLRLEMGRIRCVPCQTLKE